MTALFLLSRSPSGWMPALIFPIFGVGRFFGKKKHEGCTKTYILSDQYCGMVVGLDLALGRLVEKAKDILGWAAYET